MLERTTKSYKEIWECSKTQVKILDSLLSASLVGQGKKKKTLRTTKKDQEKK